MLSPEFLRSCTNPLCERTVPANYLGERQVLYCCSSCDYAHAERFEIHDDGPLGHSPGCNERHEDRAGRKIDFPF